MADSLASTPEKSQYHHFIPRFILRNWSHLVESPTGTSRSSKRRTKRKNGPRPTEPMLYGINLSGEEPEIMESSVAKTFGMVDMYRDVNASTKQHQIEEQLSVLESQAGEVISAIRKAFEAGNDDVWITRTQRDTLRKFLFIMKYRGSRFHRRYHHQNADDYSSNDKGKMLKYMKEKGITRPVDVWFDNIKGILDLKMDHELKWMEKLKKRIYPDDAAWFINNVQQFYMALVTPTFKEDEFLLTQNAYSIHEGVSTDKLNPLTGHMEPSAYTEFHLFAPIAPRLLIVLRSSLLPVPEEDQDDDIREWREVVYKVFADFPHGPGAAGISLRDLPVAKARNSYSKIVGGRVIAINGGPTGSNDRFGFRFFSIPRKYVDKINGVMLEESHRIDLIVFNNKIATYKTLREYLDCRGEFDTDDVRVKAIKKLKQAAKLLAPALPSEEIPGSHPNPPKKENLPEDKVHALFVQNEKAKQLYIKLSGKDLDSKDFDQARNLLFRRIRLDSTTYGFPETIREECRGDFLKSYAEFPVQVIWVFLKRIRFMKLGFSRIGTSNTIEDYSLPAKHLDGPEDVIAASRHLFRKEAFRLMMHHAVFNGELIAKPLWGLVGELTLDDNGLKRMQEEKALVLGNQGSICDCGIPKVEETAKHIRGLAKNKNSELEWEPPLDYILSEEEQVELLTRELVRFYHKVDKTKEPLVQDPELEHVLFDVIYPLFGARQKEKGGKGEAADEGGCAMQ